MELVQSFIIAAILAEAIVESISRLIIDRKLQWSYLAALVVGQVVAFSTQLNIFEIAGIATIDNVVGIVASGILFARGSNVIHDLIRKLQKPDIESE